MLFIYYLFIYLFIILFLVFFFMSVESSGSFNVKVVFVWGARGGPRAEESSSRGFAYFGEAGGRSAGGPLGTRIYYKRGKVD
jgi:hypothetical protein